MALKKKKKDDFEGLPVVEKQKHYPKEDIDAIGKLLERGRYLNKDGMLTLEKEMDFHADQRTIRIKKKNPPGENRTINDFTISIRENMGMRFDEIDQKLRQWKERRGYVMNVKNKNLLYPVNFSKKYMPDFVKEKKKPEELDPEGQRPLIKIPEKVEKPIEKKTPIDPVVMDPGDIKL